MSKFKHVVYGDTDSCYLHLSNYAIDNDIEMTPDKAVLIADRLQKKLQTDLSDIIAKRFVTPPDNIKILEPGREIVGRRGLFKDKKKTLCHSYH